MSKTNLVQNFWQVNVCIYMELKKKKWTLVEIKINEKYNDTSRLSNSNSQLEPSNLMVHQSMAQITKYHGR